jgi:hypothetical protein
MRAWQVLVVGLALAALAGGAIVAGCFSPDKPDCAFACAQGSHSCPDGYECRADFYCHRIGSTGACLGFADGGGPDAAVDAAPPDAGVDAPAPDAHIDAPAPDAPAPDAAIDAPEIDADIDAL